MNIEEYENVERERLLIWKTKDGTLVQIKNMSTSHLGNVIKYFSNFLNNIENLTEEGFLKLSQHNQYRYKILKAIQKEFAYRREVREHFSKVQPTPIVASPKSFIWKIVNNFRGKK